MKLKKEVSVFLDLIRGLSAQLVLIGHLLFFFQIAGFDKERGVFLMQNFGVVIFFILSGFLITYSIDTKEEEYGFKDFFIDRFSRIFIAFPPALAVIFICDLAISALDSNFPYNTATSVTNLIGNVFMLQDHPLFAYGLSKVDERFAITSFGSGRPLWSVAIEWWIYMFFGFILYQRVTFQNAILIGFLFLVPLFNMSGVGNGLSVVWFLGVLAYYFLKSDNYKLKQPYIVIFLLLAVSIYRLRMNDYQLYDLTFSVPLTFAFIIYIKQLQGAPRSITFFPKIEKFSKFISSYSFSLYLIHYSLIMLIMSIDITINKWLLMGLIFCLCNLLAWFFAYLTEFRYHAFRNFIKKRYQSHVRGER